jgi:formate dehydrogenase major subunit
MNAPVSKELLAPPSVEFKLNDQTVVGFEGESILNAAKRHGIDIPHLCYKEGMRADGNCRACVVEIKGERTLAPSCCRNVTPGLEVLSQSLRAKKSQEMVLELLLSDMPEQGHKWTEAGQHGELSDWAQAMNVTVRPELQSLRREQPSADVSHPAMAVNLDACIQCNRCVRACREEQVNDVIGYAHRGAHSQIVFDLQDPMGSSTCVACGECVQACPTGALMPKTQVGSQVVDKKVDSVCPFCGVGCLLTYNIKDNRIVSVEGRDGPANHNRLCVKGRFGLWGMCSGLPHRRTHAKDASGLTSGGQEGGLCVSILWRGMLAHLQHQRQPHCERGRARWSRQSQSLVRQGTIWL